MSIYNNSEIYTVLGDITILEVDVIVNAANNSLLGGGGVDGAIHKAGGEAILLQTKEIGGCPTGEARITTAGNMPSKYVIHTVGPIYNKGDKREERLLYLAYYNSLKLAKEYNLRSIAFPSISTGAYGYPKDKSIKIAFSSVLEFLRDENSMEKVMFVLHTKEDLNFYNEYAKNNKISIS